MRSSACGVAISLLVAPCALAQPELYGVRQGGQLIRFHAIDSAASSPIADLGLDVTGAWTEIWYPPGGGYRDAVRIASPRHPSMSMAPVTRVSLDTAAPVATANVTDVPDGYRIAGAGGAPYDYSRFVLLVSDNPLQEDLLKYLDLGLPSALLPVGSTGRTDIESIAVNSAGEVFVVGSSGGGAMSCSGLLISI